MNITNNFTNMLSFDIEYWHTNEFVPGNPAHDSKNSKDLTEKPVIAILNLLKHHNTKATFFVVAELAKRHPELIRKIQKAGHEVACHSYSHKRVDEMTREEFEDDNF